MLPKPRKPSGKKSASATTATLSANATKFSEPEMPLLCNGCTDSLTKNEALNCSVYNVWLHCYCAGVPRCRYFDTASSYVCIPCSLKSHATVVSELKNEISCLKAKVVELKAALNPANKKLDSATASAYYSMQNSTWNIAENGWSTVVKRGGRQRQGNANNESTSSHHQTPLTASKGEQCASLNNNEHIKSESCWSTTGMGNALEQYYQILWNNTGKSVYQNDIWRVTRWWFIIHDSEVLGNIDSKWDQLKLQVAWELEPCFAPWKDPNPACNEPNAPPAPENLDAHQSNPDMQSQSQVDKSPPTMQSVTIWQITTNEWETNITRQRRKQW